MNDISTVTVLGTGVLGSQIAFQTAFRGFAVTAYDINEEALESARERFELLAQRYQKDGVEGADEETTRAAIDRLTLTADLGDSVREADLVIEAIPELISLKRDTYERLGELAPERTIFATNSSTLLPSELKDFTGRPEKFLALHFANEVWRFNIAEVMGTADTDPAVFDQVVSFAGAIGMVPIPLHKEKAGYVPTHCSSRCSTPAMPSPPAGTPSRRTSTRSGGSPQAPRWAHSRSPTSSDSGLRTTSSRKRTEKRFSWPSGSRRTTSTRASSAQPPARASTPIPDQPHPHRRSVPSPNQSGLGTARV